jgi:hypothetical protein
MDSSISPSIRKIVFLILLATFLFACQPKSENVSTPVRTLLTTENISVPRWAEYETALANAIVTQDTECLCEWEIWGQDKQKVYVWALCETVQFGSTVQSAAGSVPAVIYLSNVGKIEKVVLPKDGTAYEELFPLDVQKRISANEFDFPSATEHIAQRRKNPDIPPMIAESGVGLP